MFAVMHNPKAAYSKAGVEAGVETADPHKLILMLFEGALLSVASASLHMKRDNGVEDVARKGEAISKAINIITNGLKASLDQTAGGELAGKLGALYDYMSSRLLHANVHNQPAILDEVSHLLAELKDAWEQIGKKS
jgi:flagellar protein FliS